MQLLSVAVTFLPLIWLAYILAVDDANQGNAKVKLTPDSDGLLHFEIKLDTVPVDYDVVVLFKAPEIKNGGTFYTDSNGLAMQERKIDQEVKR